MYVIVLNTPFLKLALYSLFNFERFSISSKLVKEVM